MSELLETRLNQTRRAPFFLGFSVCSRNIRFSGFAQALVLISHDEIVFFKYLTMGKSPEDRTITS